MTRRGGEILPFTGLRGLAAWMIVFYHFREFVLADGLLLDIVGRGEYAVDLFFVMSGFVIALSYGDDFRDGISLGEAGRFLVKRLARIYPVHGVMLLAFLSVPLALALTERQLPKLFTLDYYAKSVLLIQNWGFTDALAWNVPAWSISTELLFYIAFPLLAVAFARLARAPAVLLAIGGGVLLAIFLFGWAVGGLVEDTPRYGMVRCLLECGLGVWLFHATARFQDSRARSAGLLCAALCLIGCYAAGWLPDYAAMPAAFACLLWAVLTPDFWLSRALSHPLVVRLGQVSFSTYMVHFLVRAWVKLLLVDEWPALPVFAIYVLVVAGASVLLYRFVEEPGRLAGRRLTKRWFVSRAPVA